MRARLGVGGVGYPESRWETSNWEERPKRCVLNLFRAKSWGGVRIRGVDTEGGGSDELDR